MWGACLSPGAVVMSGPGLWPRAIHIWVCGPLTAWVWVDARGSCYHQGPCGYPRSGQLPESMLMSEGHAAAGAVKI